MNAKKKLFGMIIAVVLVICTAALTVAAMHYFRADATKAENAISGFFNSTDSRNVEFVEIKNVVITLKGTGENERYLLLEVNLATSDPEKTKSMEEMAPAIRGATVSLLSNMDYQAVREMNVGTLRDKLKTAYIEKLATLKIPVSFDDVIISKMVFQ
ncbi:flagellar basal body-associated FliL family protein [Citrobacter portucalensis]|uniref:flagellar basal body-associated FliL family protein n=1 Tax=Citrobacter portucalensis TaxID=1639133 RepID=UPI003CF3110A